ncbi:MAG: hypothetical protein GY832_21585, partial [Chloroflexi bacterium]|nr:hypothetical protein [Chloroflexota bacterium]MCP4539739.1 hypothetical protein [Chloroflexota bacterium]
MKRIMILILAVLLLSGCEEYATYTPSAADLTALAEQMPEGPTKDAVVGTAVARYEAAAQAENTITAAQAMESAARADLERVQLEMTAEAQQTAQA